MLTASYSQQFASAQADTEYIRSAEFTRYERVHDNLFSGIAKIAANVLELAAQQHDA